MRRWTAAFAVLIVVAGLRPLPLAPQVLPRAAATNDNSEQMLVALDAQIQSAAMLAHFIWSTSRFAAFAEGFASVAPNHAKVANGAAAKLRTDIEVYLDAYSNLVLQIESGPTRLNVSARIERIDQDMSEQGLAQFRRFLPILQNDIQLMEDGTPPSRQQMRAKIVSVPSAIGQPRE